MTWYYVWICSLKHPNKKQSLVPFPPLPFPSLCHIFYISKIQDGHHFFYFLFFLYSVQGVGGGPIKKNKKIKNMAAILDFTDVKKRDIWLCARGRGAAAGGV